MEDSFLNCASWQAMLACNDMPSSSAAIGLLRRQDFAARRGALLLLRGNAANVREYNGAAGEDVAVLLVGDDDALAALRDTGWEPLPALIRQGRVHPYMLKTMDELEEAGLAEFVEDLGLIFPKH